MKWFRHNSDAHENHDLRAVALRCGGEGLGWYWTLVEIAASRYDVRQELDGDVAEIKGNDGKTDLEVLAYELYCKPDELEKLEKFLVLLGERNLIDKDGWLKNRVVRIPRISSFWDDSQRLLAKERKREEKARGSLSTLDTPRQHSRNLDSDTDTDTDTNTEKEHSRVRDPGEEMSRRKKLWFEELWALYPSKTGRKQAERHFMASVNTSDDLDAIKTALENYKASERVERGFVQNGSTWFNNWKDWIVNPEVPRGSALDPTLSSFLNGGKP